MHSAILFLALILPNQVRTGHFPNQPWLEYGIAGIQIGMKSGFVVAKLGAPEQKSKPLAGSPYAVANWKATGLELEFRNGTVVSITSRKKHPNTTIPDVGASLADVVKALGEPTDVMCDPFVETPDAPPSRRYFHECLLQYMVDANKAVTEVRLDFDDYNEAKRTIAERTTDYRLEVDGLEFGAVFAGGTRRNPATGFGGRSTVIGAYANGFAINKRRYTVDIVVKVKFLDGKGKLVGEASQGLQGIQPNEFRNFRITLMKKDINAQNALVELSAPLR